jgi:hypothetical protein
MPMNRGFETRALPDQLEEKLRLESLPLHHRRQIALNVCLHVCRRYIPRPYPGLLTILTPREELRGSEEPSRGWKDFTERVQVHQIPGGHGTCVTVHAQAVGEQLRNCLLKAAEAARLLEVAGSEPVGPLPEGPR